MSEGTLPVVSKRACVIGAGFAGLALAIRLQASGVETVLVEARDRPGGRAGSLVREGFTFAAGHSALADPAMFEELWALSGRALAEDVTLHAVGPLARFLWADGASFDLAADPVALRAEIARLSPGDLAGYEEFARYAAAALAEARARPRRGSLRDPAALAGALPGLAKLQGWRSADGLVGRFIEDPRLRQALATAPLFAGANPFAASGGALAAAAHKRDLAGGLWAPEGGMGALAAAMARQFERLGGTIRLHDPVLHIHSIGDRASEVETMSGWRQRFDAVAANADVVHAWRDLLVDAPGGAARARALAERPQSPGLFAVHFGLEGSWPGIPHNTVLFGPRWRELVDDIFDHGVLPADFAMWLHHPSVTDPSLAPPGKSSFSAMIPVANLGRLPIDWETVGPMLERRVIDEIGRRLVPDIHDRIVTRFHRTPRDASLDFNAFLGSGFGPLAGLAQSAWPLVRHRDDRLANLYYAGSCVAPGGGLAGAVSSARNTAALMLEDLGR